MSAFEIIAAVLLSLFSVVPYLMFWPRIVKTWWAFLMALAGDNMEETENDNG